MNYWEIIADKLSASGWTRGCSSQIDSTGRVLFTADSHRQNGVLAVAFLDARVVSAFGILNATL
jgi:hypothetical protein